MEPLQDKFNLSREDNIFVAKKYLKDSIYRSAFLEGIAVTFPQTEAILEEAEVQGVSTKDIAKVFGIRDGWRYILNNLDKPINLQFLEELHQIVAKEDVPWSYLGVLRKESVRISGTNYMPETPNAEKIHTDLQNILSADIPNTDKALSAMFYIMRTQPFMDGNKRVGTLVCNKILVANGCGIFSLPPELKEEFSEKLIRFYEASDMADIKQLTYDKCLTGI